MLRQNRVFDRAEKCRVHAHCKQSEHHQRNCDQVDTKADPRQHKTEPANQHDQYLAKFDYADDSSLVARVRQLSGHSRHKEKRNDEYGGCDRAEQSLGLFIIIDAVNDKQHHRILKQIIVECAQ